MLDSSPEGMGCALDELIAPEGLDELEYTETPALEDLQLVLAEGYGFPLELSRRVTAGVPAGPTTLVGLAHLEGRPACTAQVTTAGEDAGVYAVATVPDARGRGLASAAVRLLSAWAFAEWRMARLQLTTHLDNPASQRVAEKAGYVREAVLRSWTEQRGTRVDLIMYSLLASDLAG